MSVRHELSFAVAHPNVGERVGNLARQGPRLSSTPSAACTAQPRPADSGRRRLLQVQPAIPEHATPAKSMEREPQGTSQQRRSGMPPSVLHPVTAVLTDCTHQRANRPLPNKRGLQTSHNTSVFKRCFIVGREVFILPHATRNGFESLSTQFFLFYLRTLPKSSGSFSAVVWFDTFLD